jgi:LDH2 family malate/lactate/ureidoglycolate dehydrogenase
VGNELVGMATAMAARDTSRKGGDGGDRIDRADEADSMPTAMVIAAGEIDVEAVDGSDVGGDCTEVWLTMMTGARGNNTAAAVASTSPALRQHDYDDGIGGSTVPAAMETALAYAMGNGTAMAWQHRRHAAVATVMETEEMVKIVMKGQRQQWKR